MRLSQVNVGCTILEGFQNDKRGTWQEHAIEKLIEKADEEAEDRGDEAEANKLEVSRSAASRFVRDLVKLGNAGVKSPEAQRMIDRCSLAEDSEQRRLATIAVARFCALFKRENR